MIGPILLAVSWLLLRLERKGLGELGFNAPRSRMRQLAGGFLVAAGVVAVQQVALSVGTGMGWQQNPALDRALVLRSVRLNVNSVLYEEFLFRGYLLYQAIRLLGARRGVLLGATAFGVYHWFSYGVFGSLGPMLFIFAYTGAFGFMLALAFARTKSIAMPIGLHLGWNLTAYLGFSGGPFGPGILLPGNGATRMPATGFVQLAFEVAWPLAFIVATSWYLSRGAANDVLAPAVGAGRAAQ